MQKTYYAVITHAEGDDDYGVMFPEVWGCFSMGDTVEQAIEYAHEALELYFDGWDKDREFPEHIAFADLKPDLGDGDDYVVTIVPITVPVRSRKVRVNISMDERIMSSIDKVSGNRSKFIEDSVLAKLATM